MSHPGWAPTSPSATEIAYYSMEIALSDAIPTFSGGLGVLAGDHVRAAADRGLPLVAVTLLYGHGFFRQEIDRSGRQREHPVLWRPSDCLEELPERIGVLIGGSRVVVRPWRFLVTGIGGHQVPVYFLDTDVAENRPEDRAVTDRLYVGDRAHRLAQEVLLGLGGPVVIDALGHRSIHVHHMNEGHAALVPVGLVAGGSHPRAAPSPAQLAEALSEASKEDIELVRRSCVFTTHTPVPAGRDRFDAQVAASVLGADVLGVLERFGFLEPNGTLDMTRLGMSFSGFVNGVSVRHRDVTQQMFPSVTVEAVTNGVHSTTWAGDAMASLLDRRTPGWRATSSRIRYATSIPLAEIRAAHDEAKRALCAEVQRRTGVVFDIGTFTIGIARRFATYKRNDLLLSDPHRLRAVAERAGPLQIVYSGKAHPQDAEAKDMVRRVVEAASASGAPVTLAYLADYGMSVARLLCAGSDVWLNTPQPPNEASGTSGMKAALNGVPSVSTFDGWWIEGHIEGVTGWAIGADPVAGSQTHAEDLYRLLEAVVVPLYYNDREAFDLVRRNAIALNGSFFSAHRMVDEYARRAYGTPAEATIPGAWRPSVDRGRWPARDATEEAVGAQTRSSRWPWKRP